MPYIPGHHDYRELPLGSSRSPLLVADIATPDDLITLVAHTPALQLK